MHTIMMGPMELAERMDGAKDVVLGRLVADGLLSDEDAKHWSQTHVFIFKRPSKISTWYGRVTGKVDEGAFDAFLAEIPMRPESKDGED